MSFLSGLFGGSNPTLNNNIATLNGISSSTANTGTSDVSDASNFFHSLLNGGASKVLAPQIGSIRQQGQQQKQTLGQFGNRSGGNNSGAQQIGDKGTAQINDMIASLTGSAASSLGSLGSSLLGTSLNATNSSTEASQQRMKNWTSSLLGQGITGAFGAAENYGLKAIGL